MQTVSVLSLLCLMAAVPMPQQDDPADEMVRLRGKFERTFQNAAGTTFRSIKEMNGNQSIVTTYDDDGNVVESHTSTFKLEKRGPVRVFTFSNATVTAGAAKGHVDQATRSYIYRLEGDVFAEVWGILEGDATPPRMFYWRRVAETK